MKAQETPQNTAQAAGPRVVIREPGRRQLVAVSPVTIWRWERQGTFPKRIQLGPNSIGWFLDEVVAWLEERERGTRGRRS